MTLPTFTILLFIAHMMETLLKLTNLSPPPSISLSYNKKEFNYAIKYLNKASSLWSGMKPILAKRTQLGKEMYLLSRLIYKYKGAFRRWRVMQKMRQTHTRLKKEAQMKTTTLLEEFFANLTLLTAITEEAATGYLPSRQMAQYILVQLLLSLSLWHDCQILCLQCYGFVCGHMAQEEFVPNMLVVAGVISKIWTLSQKLCTAGIQLYNGLFAAFSNLLAAEVDLLPPGEELPAVVDEAFFNKLTQDSNAPFRQEDKEEGTDVQDVNSANDNNIPLTAASCSSIKHLSGSQSESDVSSTGTVTSSSLTSLHIGGGGWMEDLGRPLTADNLPSQKVSSKPAKKKTAEKADEIKKKTKKDNGGELKKKKLRQGASPVSATCCDDDDDEGVPNDIVRKKKKKNVAKDKDVIATDSGSGKTTAHINVIDDIKRCESVEQVLACVNTCKTASNVRDYNNLTDGVRILRKKFNKSKDTAEKAAILATVRKLSIAWVKKYFSNI